jgi:hypothetical protein
VIDTGIPRPKPAPTFATRQDPERTRVLIRRPGARPQFAGTLWGRYSMHSGTNWYKQQHGCNRQNYMTLLHLCATLQLHPNPTKSSQTPFHGGNTGSNPVGDAKKRKPLPFQWRNPRSSEIDSLLAVYRYVGNRHLIKPNTIYPSTLPILASGPAVSRVIHLKMCFARCGNSKCGPIARSSQLSLSFPPALTGGIQLRLACCLGAR